MKDALVFGASGQIGMALLERLLDDRWHVHAVSRNAHEARVSLKWLRGDFSSMEPLPPQVDTVFSCGPLDLFAQWYACSIVETPRVVAFDQH
jgi:uncharacterized protein YbjT (DUF2867 family)